MHGAGQPNKIAKGAKIERRVGGRQEKRTEKAGGTEGERERWGRRQTVMTDRQKGQADRQQRQTHRQ